MKQWEWKAGNRLETQEDSGTDYLERRWVDSGREGSSESNR